MEIPLIEIKSASISFGKKNVLQNVSVKSELMSNTVILGKNGSGKSVLLKIAAGLLVPDSGEVFFDGKKKVWEKKKKSGLLTKE